MTKKQDNENLESRRSFIKKAAYVAPTIIALGSLTKPVSAAASGGVRNTNPGGNDRSTGGDSGNTGPGTGFGSGF